ncbi:MAG: hypothetical protein HZC51_12795 [Nitrospirae bacterium]|nr:hypothetical protein [Nitrospirota bacterium]
MKYSVYKSHLTPTSFMFTDTSKPFPTPIATHFLDGTPPPPGTIPEPLAEEFDGDPMTFAIIRDDGTVVDTKTDAALDIDPVELAADVASVGYYIVDECTIETFKDYCIRLGYSYPGEES